MHEWRVTLTQSARAEHRVPAYPNGRTRRTVAVCFAVDARQAARRAQRVLPGWTAVLCERLDETAAARAQRLMSGDLS